MSRTEPMAYWRGYEAGAAAERAKVKAVAPPREVFADDPRWRHGWDSALTAIRAATPSPAIPEAGLDRAWKEAEAATWGQWLSVKGQVTLIEPHRWWAKVEGAETVEVSGPTPTAALQALTERLRAEPAEKGEPE